jgi:hypothetical protein
MVRILDFGEEIVSYRARAIKTQNTRIVSNIEFTEEVIMKKCTSEAIALRRDVIYALYAELAYSDEVVTTTKLIE